MTKKLVALCALLALLLGGCATEEDSADEVVEQESESSRVTFKTSEYAYDAPSTFEGGLTEIEIDNSGAKRPTRLS